MTATRASSLALKTAGSDNPSKCRNFETLAMTDVTQILSQIDAGDPTAAEQLLPLVYEELRKLAAARLSQEKPGQTLQATALVHEAYLRLLGPAGQDQPWNNRGHFFAAAAEAMRRILVDSARRRASAKRGGDLARIELDDCQLSVPERCLDLVALDEALNKLAELDERKSQVVKLRFFGGLTIAQVAEVLQISESTADADWAYAKAWLRIQIGS
jgi:RNA polymerase sigma factor (TIGR02999 family)